MKKYKKPSVLWVTLFPVGGALSILRGENILFDLFYRDEISGYGILSSRDLRVVGNVSYFDVVCCQREGSNVSNIRDIILNDTFILDLDDLLFANACYRKDSFDAWKKNHLSETLELLLNCQKLSVTSNRLAVLLEKYTNVDCLGKSVVIPNCLVFPDSFADRSVNKTQALIWTSSDLAALVKSRDDVIEASFDFCDSKCIPIYLFGKFPNNLGINYDKIKNFGMVDFMQHKQLLHKLSGKVIAISPLETDADLQTLDFISGKSDLKIVEYGGYGIECVYSDSDAFAQSDLQINYMPKNKYDDWVSALNQAYENPQISEDNVSEIRFRRSVSRVSFDYWLPTFKNCIRDKIIEIASLEKLCEIQKKQPLIKKIWSYGLPKSFRRKVDPFLKPIFG